MKTPRIIALATLAVLSTLSAPVFAQGDLKEQLTIPLTDPAKPGTLKVHLISGSIRVTGYSGNQVVIEASTKQPDKPEKPRENTEGMKRISKNGSLDISATEEKNVVNVSSRLINARMDLNIKVPMKFSLSVGTVNQGDVLIENVDGEMEITNVNGDIRLVNISGSAVANTVNGVLKANFKTVDAKSPMAFSTLNGNVDVTLPATAKFDVKIKSDQGEIYSDFDVDVDKSAPQATRSAKDGMYKVTIDDWVKGKVNGGGSEIMMKNMNGNIYVRKAK
ncbi:DUF4097 family beta strand repeat-containing protein [Dyadobacter fermentans]|uniref:DUF4097 domain-containing protein n=1 Tax=Dyadobacter fermentans (strain ATCC 700827 / DSM 18053 / CIP 107007 / KCTC 52180 / NS114) TaxID=471854 RepID=C6W517_DYAFD|nr:DUF4097 family beta strand repeat-containing protein [Dyadobacter fermentans]ACT92377.1 conserved hypothetical protein [Dyadobacter fermentans DSM 18053]